MFRITLPLPPSVNEMYRHNGRVTYKTKVAKDWIAECLKLIKVKKTITGKVDADLHVYLLRERDLDNTFKALFDVLQESKVIKDDKQIYSILATKAFDKKNPRIEVVLTEND